MKVFLAVQVWGEAGAGSGWHCRVAGGRTYMGRHDWVQIIMVGSPAANCVIYISHE